MPTFLELCQTVHEEVEERGSITAVASATGDLLRICNDVIKANRKIQIRKGNWNFLWAQGTVTTNTGATDPTEYDPPADIGSFDEASFYMNSGTVDGYPLSYVDYKKYRDSYKNQYIDAGEVSVVTEKPNGQIGVTPEPDTSGNIISFDYWSAPVDLAADADVSAIPPRFHRAIVAQAKQYYAERAGDNGLFDVAYIEHETVYRALKAYSLPGNRDDARSEAVVDLITVAE